MLTKAYGFFRWATLALLVSLGGCTAILGDFTIDETDGGSTGMGGSAGAGGGNRDGGDSSVSPDSSIGGSRDGGPDGGGVPIIVTPTDGLVTTESGGQATFTIVLTTKPTGPVVIALQTGNDKEGTVAPLSVTFSATNYNAPQTITVTGIDDNSIDGNQPYQIITSQASSSDPTYAGFNPPDVTVTNIDNESAGFILSRTRGLETSESGSQDTFTIVLTSAPTADVTVSLNSSDPNEGTVSPASVKFTPVNWAAPQTVTVTGVDDLAADGPKAYNVITVNAQSADPSYNNFDIPDVGVTNIDNDSAGITVTPRTGLTTSENGTMATFTIVLNSPPTSNVVIPLESSNVAEGIVSPMSVTFTPLNWKAPQTVAVTGVDDPVADGNQLYLIRTQPAQSADTGYNNLNAADVAVTNIDNDQAGIVVTPRMGLVTTEATGGSTTFTVVLTSRPGDTVTLDMTTMPATEGTVSPATLTFTRANWMAPQTVTLTGVDDLVADGDQPYVVRFATPVSNDTAYRALVVPDVSVINRDNDSAGFIVTPTTGLVTTEAGGTATFTVVLTSKPRANVVIPLLSDTVAEGTVAPATLTFTPDNYAAPQTVTVTGANDNVADGAQPYRIITNPATSTDPGYSMLNAPDVSVTNTDNDSPGITVTVPMVGLITSEAGGFSQFTVVLNSQPTASVTLSLTSTDPGEGTVAPATLTFTAANWNAPQTVTVTGVDDFEQDGPQPYAIAFTAAISQDMGYSGRDPLDVPVTNADNDSAGITIAPLTGLVTTEAGGTARFTVVLNSRPLAGTVAIGLLSSDTAEGTVSPATVTFTTDNWNAPQTVTVTGVNDAIADGNQPYTIVTARAVAAGDANYAPINPPDVSVTNMDNDVPGYIVTPVSGLVTTEDLGTATFTVVLVSQPRANVVIGVSSSNVLEGTVSPASLTFTPANWNAPQTVTVRGVNDDAADGNQPYTIVLAAATSTDVGYSGLNPPDVSVTNNDNDSAGISVTAAANLRTTEAGGTVTFSVVLTSLPTGNVVIPIVSNDTTEGTVSPGNLTFTTTNWNAPQTVTVTGVDDIVVDGNQPYTIRVGPATSSDGNYQARSGSSVPVTNVDLDQPGITVSAASGHTREPNGTATFTIVLNNQPQAPVTIPLSSSDLTEGTLAVAQVMFTSANWNAPQTITVTGADDAVQDGNQPYNIVTGASLSSDMNYNGINADDVALVNDDNDTAGIVVNAAANLTTSEGGGTATFTVVLNTQPTANVTIPIASTKSTEGIAAPASLVFSTMTGVAGGWNLPQTVTVTGRDDLVADGNQPYLVRVGPATSTDANYNTRTGADVSLTNTDNDQAGITVTPLSPLPLTTTEAGGTISFTIVLTSQPAGAVIIPIVSTRPGEGIPNQTVVQFDPTNYNTAQTVIVTGVNDLVADGPQPYQIVSDPNNPSLGFTAQGNGNDGYSNLSVPGLQITNTDDEPTPVIQVAAMAPGCTGAVNAVSCDTSNGGAATFTVRLLTQPTANVSVSIPTVADEASASPMTIAFTPMAGSWDTPVPVTLTGLVPTNPAIRHYTVQATATSTDMGYGGLIATVAGVNNPPAAQAALVVTAGTGCMPTAPVSCATTNGATAMFDVGLATQPASDVTVTIASTSMTEGRVVAPIAPVVFSTSSWNTPVTVTITGQDTTNATDVPYQVTLSASALAGNPYNAKTATVNVTNGAITTDPGDAGTDAPED